MCVMRVAEGGEGGGVVFCSPVGGRAGSGGRVGLGVLASGGTPGAFGSSAVLLIPL